MFVSDLLSESVPDAVLPVSVLDSEEVTSESVSVLSTEPDETTVSSIDSWTAAAMTAVSGRAVVAIKTDSITASSFFFIAYLLVRKKLSDKIVFEVCQLLGYLNLREALHQERLGVLAAPREVRSTFLIARLRSAGGFNL